MADIRTKVVLEVDDSNLKKDINNSLNGVGRDVNNLSKKQGNQYGKGFKAGFQPIVGQIAGILGGIGFVELGKQALLFNDNLRRAEANYTRLLGSAEAAQTRVDEIIEAAKITPLRQDELIQADQLLQGFGIRTERTFEGIIDASSATGQNIGDLALILGQLSQDNSLENIKQLAERGIITFEDLKKSGIEFAKDGSIVNSTEETFQKVLDIISNKFEGAAEEASKTLTGQISTAIDTVNIQLGELAEKSGAYDFITNLIGDFNQLAETSPELANGIIGVSIAVGILTSALLALGGPATAVIFGLVAAASALKAAWDNDIGGIQTQTEELGKRFEEIFTEMGLETEDLQEVIRILGIIFQQTGGLIGGVLINFGNQLAAQFEGAVMIMKGFEDLFAGRFVDGIKKIFGGLGKIIIAPLEYAYNNAIDMINSLIRTYNRLNDAAGLADLPEAQKLTITQSFEKGGFPVGANAIVRTNEAGQEYIANARATSALQTFFREIAGDFGASSSIDNSDNSVSYTQNNFGGPSNSGFRPPYAII